LSVFGKIAGFFSGAAKAVVDVVHKVEWVFSTVWSFLVAAAHLIDEAWDWIVNGVEYFTEQVTSWAAWVFNTLNHILTKVIPEAVEWVLGAAVKWAKAAVHDVSELAKGLYKETIGWALKELNKLRKKAEGLVGQVVTWVTTAVHWVEKYGAVLLDWIEHPSHLAEYLAAHLIVPLIKWALKASAPVLVWVFRSLLSWEGEIVTLLEDVISKVL